jgi:Bacteriophage minor capsid protein
MMLDEIGDYLQVNGLTPVYRGSMADQPDAAICLYEYGGAAPEFAHDGQVYENLRLQAVSRHREYATAYSRSRQIYDLLNGKANVTISGQEYLWIASLQSPFSIGPDQNQRVLIVINFEVLRK